MARASAVLPPDAVGTGGARPSWQGSTVNAKRLAEGCGGVHTRPLGQGQRFEPAHQSAEGPCSKPADRNALLTGQTLRPERCRK